MSRRKKSRRHSSRHTINWSRKKEIICKTLCVTDALQEEKSKLEVEMAVPVEMTQNIVAENARVAQDQDEY